MNSLKARSLVCIFLAVMAIAWSTVAPAPVGAVDTRLTPTPSKNPDGSTTAEKKKADKLVTLLEKEEFTREELAAYGFYSAELDTERFGDEPVYPNITFNLSSRGNSASSLAYWVYPNDEVAALQYDIVMSQMQQDFPVRTDLSDQIGFPTTILEGTMGWSSGVYILVGNVIAVGVDASVNDKLLPDIRMTALLAVTLALVHLYDVAPGDFPQLKY